MEDCAVSAFFVVFSEVTEGVQISQVSDPTIEGAIGCSCAMLSKTGFDDRLLYAGIKGFRRGVEERCSYF